MSTQTDIDDGTDEDDCDDETKKDTKDADDIKKWDMKMFNVMWQIDIHKRNTISIFWTSNDKEIKSVRIPKRLVSELSAVMENCYNRAEQNALKHLNKKSKKIVKPAKDV